MTNQNTENAYEHSTSEQSKQPDSGSTASTSVWSKAISVLSIVAFVFSLLVLIALWSGMFWAFANAEEIGESNPMLTPGVIELISYALGFATIAWLCAVLIWRFFGKWRWIALPLAPFVFALCMWGLGQYFRVVFDGDMNPIRVEAIQRQYELEPTGNEIGERTLVAAKTDFPRFLGADQTQRIDWLTLPSSKKDMKLEVEWRQPIGYGWSGFIAVDGVAFTLEQQGPWECVSAYRIQDGELLWVHKDRHRHDDPAGGIGPRSTPTFHQGRLYTLGSLGTLNCLNAANGELVWQKELTEVFQIPFQVFNEGTDKQYDAEKTNLIWGRAASPLIVGNQVIVPVGGDKASGKLRSLAAFSIDDGSLSWEGGQHQLSYGSATMGTLDGMQQILITNESTVAGHDPATGQQLWQFSRPGDSGGGANTSQPIIVSDNQVLLSKEYGLGGQLLEVSKQDGQWKAESIWKKANVLRTKLTVPIIDGQYAYCISGGILECTHWPTGKRQWRGARVQHGQMLLVDGRLLIMSEDGTLMLVTCTPDEFIVEFQQEGLLDGRCWNMLCITGDKLLARSELEATCIKLPTAKPVSEDPAN